MSFFGDESVASTGTVDTLGQNVSAVASLASRALAVAVLAIYLPALIGVAMLVALSSQGPIIIKRGYRRRSGELVYLYEYRTECWRTWEETPVGRLIRRTDLHRLPRLANVVLGEVLAGERVERIGA